MRARFALPLLALSLAACEGDPVTVCSLPSNELANVAPAPSAPLDLSVAPLALRVTVLDAATGQDLSPGATGAWVSGAMADSLYHVEPSGLQALGPSGRYSVVVQHAGYVTWGRDDVQVRAGECGPIMEEVTARLVRVGGP